ncbi:hypothetical protein BBJ28_00011334 [Nothophytophthora sp. Chile5]|nr:hypothetical protein BBJ28_00011334 [Nothophytophthora sp. Chile5]
MGNSLVRVNGKVYEVLGSLGEGGFAHVYEVRRDGCHFALKWTRRVTEGEDLERLLLEIQVQRRLVHPNVLALTAAEVRRRQSSSAAEAVTLHPTTHQLQDRSRLVFDGTAEKEVLMLFPIASRGSLQSFLDEAARKHTPAFTEHDCLRFFALLVDAVAALHDLGFAHRDIKPGNILLTSSDPVEPLLMDFGSVAPLQVTVTGRMENKTLWEEAARYSSAPYRAPELWDAGTDSAAHVLIDGRTDVWALGCVLYALAFGPLSPFEHPRDGVQQLAILNGNTNFPQGSIGQTFTPTFIALIKWILTPDMAERPTLEGVRRYSRKQQQCYAKPVY